MLPHFPLSSTPSSLPSRTNVYDPRRSRAGSSSPALASRRSSLRAHVSKDEGGGIASHRFLCVRLFGILSRFWAREKSPRVFPKGKKRDFSRPSCCRSPPVHVLGEQHKPPVTPCRTVTPSARRRIPLPSNLLYVPRRDISARLRSTSFWARSTSDKLTRF